MGQLPAVCDFGPLYTQTCSGISFVYINIPAIDGGLAEEYCTVFASCQDGVGGSVQTSCSSPNCFPLGNVVEISSGVMLCQGVQSSSRSLCNAFVRATSSHHLLYLLCALFVGVCVLSYALLVRACVFTVLQCRVPLDSCQFNDECCSSICDNGSCSAVSYTSVIIWRRTIVSQAEQYVVDF